MIVFCSAISSVGLTGPHVRGFRPERSIYAKLGESHTVVIVQGTWIHAELPNDNHAVDNFIRTSDATGYECHGLYYADLSAYAGITVDWAKLHVYRDGLGSSQDLAIYRVTAQWNENQVTWNDRLTGTPWTNPGGDYDAVALDTINFATDSWNSWDITDAVNGWLAGTYSNYGLISVCLDVGSNLHDHWSEDYADPALRPYIEMWY